MNGGDNPTFIASLDTNAHWRADDREFFRQYCRKLRLREIFPDEFPDPLETSETKQMVIYKGMPAQLERDRYFWVMPDANVIVEGCRI